MRMAGSLEILMQGGRQNNEFWKNSDLGDKVQNQANLLTEMQEPGMISSEIQNRLFQESRPIEKLIKCQILSP